ncbi:MAG: hypothetical protein LC674_07460 [Actinobacteria bacterium]|nr:hypothetical protein [Actinomycetota bacterium]
MNIAKFAVSAAVLGVIGASAVPAIASSDVPRDGVRPSSFRALNQIQATPLKDEELSRIEGGQLINISVDVRPNLPVNVPVNVNPNVNAPVTISVLGGR